MRILIAYDGSLDAEVAVEDVASRPWPKGTKVRVVLIPRPAKEAGSK